MGEPQLKEDPKKQSVAADVGKLAVKKIALTYLKIPILIAIGIIFFIFLIAGLILSFSFHEKDFFDAEGGDGGWQVGNITEFGANEIPAEYIPVYKEAGAKYNVPWNLLAAHHRVETRFSTISPMISPVGATGHMQFMPLTWIGWSYPGGTSLGNAMIPNNILTDPKKIKKYGGYGTDGDGDGRADPMNLKDAMYTAAKYLAASGAADGKIREAVYAYNHSTEYVNDVLGYAEAFVSGYKEISVGGMGSGSVPANGGMKGVMESADAWTKKKTKYVWGAGRTQGQIDKGWFDCSGFIYAMLRSNGINWAIGNTDTLVTQGKRVPASDLQVGDLIFFDSYKKNGHVGFYAGNGKFIGSQSSTGVAYASMTSGYWGDRYNGVVIRVK